MFRRDSIVLLLSLSVLFACSTDPHYPPVTPVGGELVARGGELFKGLAACSSCHGEVSDPESLPVGGMIQYDRYGAVSAANLTPASTGLGEWSAIEIIGVLRGGRGRSGEYLSQEVHLGYEWLSERDLLALIAFLRSIPPNHREIDRREVSFFKRQTTGFLERERQVTGYVPSINPKYELAYGKYLVDHVARCGSCHNSAGSFFTSEQYLGGGAVVRRGVRELVAPNITAAEDFGIGTWSEADIVRYLTTGITPDGNEVDAEFCPVRFYRNAGKYDLEVLAKYLKSVSPAG